VATSHDPVRMLLTFGASINKTDKVQGNSARHWACQTGNHVCIKLLLEAGADLNLLNAKVLVIHNKRNPDTDLLPFLPLTKS
jgi:ankyrin repeat protein